MLGGGLVIQSLVGKLRLRVRDGGRGEVAGGGRGTQGLITGVGPLMTGGARVGGRKRRGGGRRLGEHPGSGFKWQQRLDVAGDTFHIL